MSLSRFREFSFAFLTTQISSSFSEIFFLSPSSLIHHVNGLSNDSLFAYTKEEKCIQT